MTAFINAHLVVAILLCLCALIFSWNPGGRRVVNAVAGLQVILGIALAAFMGMNHLAIPNGVWVHLLIAILIMASYGLAMRAGKRAGGANQSMVYALIGVALVILNTAYGWKMAGH